MTAENVEEASIKATAALDESLLRVRFDRLTPKEKKYLREMSELGAGPHRSGEIAAGLGKSVNSFAPVRQSLIIKGMLWSPSHDDTAFTVPLFNAFMKRIMPGDSWKTEQFPARIDIDHRRNGWNGFSHENSYELASNLRPGYPGG